MKYLNLILLLTSIAMVSCNSKGKSSESTQPKTKLQPKDQIEFIREKHALIESKMESKTNSVIELVKETEVGAITYKRAMDGENIMYAYSSDCDDHGCSQSSYYFWDNKLIFKFDQSSSWVGQSDKISEKRTYYLDETEILCLQKTKTGTGGYDTVNQLLIKTKPDTLMCNRVFDRSSIKDILEFTNNNMSKPKNDVIKELAIVKKVEDAGYPMFMMTFYFIERIETETIFVDRESIIFSDAPLTALIEKKVMVSYLNANKTHMHRLYGATDEIGEIDPEWKILKGVLQHIEGGTSEDLPDQLTVEAKDGSTIVFDYYIDAEMKALSKKPVTIYYTTSAKKQVTELKLAEETPAISESKEYIERSDVGKNWIYAENDKFIVRVDKLIDNTFRYTSWNKPKKITDTPDLILNNGKAEQQGTGGGYHYIFNNNAWNYRVMDVWMAETDENMGIFLNLTNSGETKLNTKLIDLKTKKSNNQQVKADLKSHYICYTDDNNKDRYIWIKFSNGKAKQIKYDGNGPPIDLVFTKESENLNPGGPYPVFANYYNEIIDNKIYGVYKLTHSGIYDYVEYTRAEDSKVFNFTIDHNSNPYGASPCF